MGARRCVAGRPLRVCGKWHGRDEDRLLSWNAGALKAWISPVSGGAPAPLGQFEGNVGGLTWSPDGRWVAFNWTPTSGGGSRLAKIRVGSGEPAILAEQGCAFSPAWSPDSSRILCSTGGVLYTIPAEGGQREFLD